MVTIKKIYNNNVALVDYDGISKIISGNGIAFKKKNGDAVDRRLIREQYVLEGKPQFKFYDKIFANIDREILDAIEQVLRYAAKALETTFNSSTKLAIIDHLYYAIQKSQDGGSVDETYLGNVKKIHPQEYKLAENCAQIINSRLGIHLDQNDCNVIALPFVGAVSNEEKRKQIAQERKMINDILNIIGNQYKEELDSDSNAYEKLCIQIGHMVQDLLNGKMLIEIKDVFLYGYYKEHYERAYLCGWDIHAYIKEQLNVSLKENELLCLIIHIANLSA